MSGHSAEDSTDSTRQTSLNDSGHRIQPYEYRDRRVQTHTGTRGRNGAATSHRDWAGGDLGSEKSFFGTPSARGWEGHGVGGALAPADLRFSQKKRVREVLARLCFTRMLACALASVCMEFAGMQVMCQCTYR